ncbi:hypothetical protein H4R20_002816 [Coemansia guatemalensis]|uniref:Pre-mRNA-splicing factor 18 n=1 Tax=Coemansia guatemalensis TaxID=2761395 RepID=A0A9W8I0S0_9FUNG|nr:hypothetical protein H4R20_002816 [Coemansia guatemalensis]
MDLLKDAISREVKKRKSDFGRAARGNSGRNDNGDSKPKHAKYVRVADLKQASEVHDADSNGHLAGSSSHSTSSSADHVPGSPTAEGGNKKNTAAQDEAQIAGHQHGDDASSIAADGQALSGISSDEVVKRLRARGEPIRLFGESDEQRRRRLRHLELSEEKTDGQQNEFRRMMAQVEAGAMLESLKRQANMDDDEEEKRRQKFAMLMEYDVSDISLELLRTDMDRLNTLLYVYFKRLLYEWGDYLASRPEDERRSAEGKMAAATQRQSAEYLKPLFRSLKQRKLQADVMARITEIARSTLDREYMNANDAYLQLSVGNAPWPIGITQVGIHSRAARENISASKVAHVLNDETQRKWIQSIKRLIRFAQTKYPPADMSKLAG